MNRSLLLAALTTFFAQAATPLPLPQAPVRIVIPDPDAFDAALTSGYRQFLTGAPDENDPVVSAWRKTQVGSKLEDQWSRLSKDLPWTWEQIHALQPTAVGIALLQVGHLEAVLVQREWLAAGQFTVADILMADALRVPKVLAAAGDFPAIRSYVDRAYAGPAFKRAYDGQMAHFAAGGKQEAIRDGAR